MRKMTRHSKGVPTLLVGIAVLAAFYSVAAYMEYNTRPDTPECANIKAAITDLKAQPLTVQRNEAIQLQKFMLEMNDC